jgi:hypothetical protein
MPIKPQDLPPAPPHPDLEIVEEQVGFARHLRVDVVRFRHRLFAGGWSGERVFDVVRRGGGGGGGGVGPPPPRGLSARARFQ